MISRSQPSSDTRPQMFYSEAEFTLKCHIKCEVVEYIYTFQCWERFRYKINVLINKLSCDDHLIPSLVFV